jgi:hypothetical protein
MALAADPRPLDLRPGLAGLSRGLIAYGIVALIVAAIGFGLIVWANDRLGRIGREVDASVGQLATTLDRTAEALHDASTTAGTFSSTLDQGATSMPAVSQQIAGVRTDLGAVEGQLRSLSLFGATPLASAADAVGRIGVGLEGLDTQLSLAAVALGANRDALAANSASIGRLGDSAAALAARLRSGVIEDSFGDVQQVILLMLLVFTAVSVVPAVGAIVLGVWLWRTLARSGSGSGSARP